MKKGFSLIELLVVISIVGILSAIAIPAYNTYSNRTVMLKAVTIMDGLLKGIANTYATKGAFPSTLTLNGISFGAFQNTRVAYGPIEWISFQGSSVGMVITCSLTGLKGIPGYVEPSISGNGAFANLNFGIRAQTGSNGAEHIIQACGGFLQSLPFINSDIPAANRKGICSAEDVYYYK